MSRFRVYERWRCKTCGTERLHPGRTMAWVHREGISLPCVRCCPSREPWTDHEYIGDAPREVQ